jgi:hypothetical protein
MPYTFNGSYPLEPEDTRGWIEVSGPPPVPEGKELVWLNWEWVVRDPKPESTETSIWKWNHETKQWIDYSIIPEDFVPPVYPIPKP